MSMPAERPTAPQQYPQGPQPPADDQRLAMIGISGPEGPTYFQRILAPGEVVNFPIADMPPSFLPGAGRLIANTAIKAAITPIIMGPNESGVTLDKLPLRDVRQGIQSDKIDQQPSIYVGDGRQLPAAYEAGVLNNPEMSQQTITGHIETLEDALAAVNKARLAKPSVVVGTSSLAEPNMVIDSVITYPLGEGGENYHISALVIKPQADSELGVGILPCPANKAPKETVRLNRSTVIGWLIAHSDGIIVTDGYASQPEHQPDANEGSMALLVSAASAEYLKRYRLKDEIRARLSQEPPKAIDQLLTPITGSPPLMQSVGPPAAADPARQGPTMPLRRVPQAQPRDQLEAGAPGAELSSFVPPIPLTSGEDNQESSASTGRPGGLLILGGLS